MKKLILFILLLISINSVGYTDISNKVFNEANEHYKNKNYKLALKNYKNLIDQGYSSPELFYNISNTYYKLGDLPHAVLYSEKAYRLSPRNKDIRYNKNLIFTQTKNKDTSLDKVISFFSLNELLYFTFICFTLFFIFLFLGNYFFYRWIFWIRILLVCTLIISTVWTYTSYKMYYFNKYCIINKNNTNAYTGPSEDNSIGFTLPLGHRVDILSKETDWIEVGEKNKRLKGWIHKSKVLRTTTSKD